MISTSFTWRTFLAGMLAGSLVGTLFYWITPFKAGQAFAMATIASSAGMFGHFVMKALKRDAGVQSNWRDEGHPVTGAVGLLDRVGALASRRRCSSTRCGGIFHYDVA